MAGLLLTALCCIPLAGCLIPQDEDVLPELPPKRNGAIKIVAQDPTTPRTSFFSSTALCPNPTNRPFTLTIVDEDVADLVYSLWFIDGTNTTPYEPTAVQGGNSTSRTVSAPRELGFRNKLANLNTGTHILTVYVSDTDFEEVVGGNVVMVPRTAKWQLPDGTFEVDVGSTDTFTWTLEVEPCQ